MGFLTDWLTDWLKELLIEGIMGNLTGLFDTVNSRVGEIAVQVGTTPAAWNAGVFSLIRQLSETVILPIAGLILTFVATYELIQLIIEMCPKALSPGQPGSCKAQRTFQRPCLPTWRPRWKRWGLALCWGCGCNPYSFM